MARTPLRRRVRNALRVYLRELPSGRRAWWCHVPGEGRRSLGLDDATPYDAAYRFACERFAAGDLAPRESGPPRKTLTEIIKAYLHEEGDRYKPRSRHALALRLVAFVEAMSAQKIDRPDQITDAALSTWISARLDTKVTHATINRTLVAARVALRWASKRTPPLCAVTPVETRKNLREVERTSPPVIPSPAEWRRVVSALVDLPCPVDPSTLHQRTVHRANARGAALLVAVAVQTGLRLDELRHLRACDVRDGAVEVAAREGWSPKSWQERTVPIPAATATLAREFVAWRTTARGMRGQRLALGDHWIADLLDAAWARAGLAGGAPRMHDCRRTFATELSRRGEPLTVVRSRLGHQDVQTTERYLGSYRDDPARVVPDLGVGDVLALPGAVVLPFARRVP